MQEVSEESDLLAYFHFNNPQKPFLIDFVSKNEAGPLEYLQKLPDGEPLEHSDKWGKTSIPYSVQLPSPVTLQQAASTEFWALGSVTLNSIPYNFDTWTHVCL